RLAARVEGKSSLARLGLVIHMTAPTIHADFEGRIRLEMMNHGAVPIRLWPGMRICQLIFETTLGTAERGYRGQFAGQTVRRRKKQNNRLAGGGWEILDSATLLKRLGASPPLPQNILDPPRFGGRERGGRGGRRTAAQEEEEDTEAA